MNEQPLLLVIDDETEILKTLKDSLEDENFRIQTLSNGHKALDLIGKLIPDLILLDIFMPNCNGLELLSKIKKEYPQQRIIIISGFGNISMATEAIKKGALDFIEKPLNLDEILSKIDFIKKEYKTDLLNKTKEKIIKPKNEQEKIKNELGIIGQSFLFSELIQQIDKIANLGFPVIIYGQHGTGKSLIAKYIHQTSDFAKKPFKVINCSLSHEKFSEKLDIIFNQKIGSIYLKNIDDLEIEDQKKLLSHLEINKKTRLIASSTKSIFNLCYENKFNKTLYYKLNITPIEIPPLIKRRYDIPLLIDHFLNQQNSQQNKEIILNNRSIRFLRNFNWTENITQLKNLIQQIIATTKEKHKIISLEDLSTYFKEKEIIVIEEQSFLRFNSLNEATTEFERKFLLYNLQKHHYNIDQVCDRLNLTPPQLKDKMLKLNL